MNVEEIVTEKQLNEELSKFVAEYAKASKLLEDEFDFLYEEHEKFPKKYSDKDDFENFLLLASSLKHRSIKFMKNSMAIEGRITSDFEYFESMLKIHLADTFLNDKGFDKVTDQLRTSYTNSNKNMKEIKKYKSAIKSFVEIAEKMVRAFDADEVDCRKFLDMKNKLRGLL
jgi:uncharacterized protein YaaR (DUF327 family)